VRIKVLACRVLLRELTLVASSSKNVVDITYLRQSFHDQPELLRKELESEIARIDGNFDAVVLAYGLCSRATAGLRSPRYRLVVPRAHDCITLLLGSRERYRDYFDRHPGTYWYTCGWNESVPMPGERRYASCLREYTEKFGAENAEYLMAMEQEWIRAYDRAVFVHWPEIESGEAVKETREAAAFLRWQYDELEGRSELLRALIEGDWDERFLVLGPGETAEPSFDETIVRKAESDA